MFAKARSRRPVPEQNYARAFAWVILLLWFCPQTLCAQTPDTIHYTISFPQAIHHEAEIRLEIGLREKQNVTLVMSKTSPGRYAVHNFAKNIYNIHAFSNGQPEPLTYLHIQPDAWIIQDAFGNTTIGCTLFANHIDGTYSSITNAQVLLNIPSALPWLSEFTDNPITVRFVFPDTARNTVVTQLPILDSARHIYFAPNLQYLMDSPVIIGDVNTVPIPVSGEKDNDMRLAMLGEMDEGDLLSLTSMTTKVIEEQRAVFGELPLYDFGTYTFLCTNGLSVYNDGMEHRNSTVITAPSPAKINDFIGTISHEFFHCWNAERIRPAALEPFDFTRANVCGELWFAEGFTSYYGDIVLCRAGIVSPDEYVSMLGRKINTVINAPGRLFGSPVHMSQMAPFTDEAASIDETNFNNTFLSYYIYGEAIAVALDLRLRTEFKEKSLDDLMKAMWNNYGKNEKGYTNEDLKATLADVTGNPDFATEFFNKYIFGNELPDFTVLLDKAGYKFVKKNPGKTSAGIFRMKFDGGKSVLTSEPLYGSPLYNAGVSEGDEIVTIDSQPVPDYAELNYIIGTRKAGDEVKIVFSHNGKTKESNLKLEEDNQYIVIPKEQFSIKLKEDEIQLRTNWLGSKVTKK